MADDHKRPFADFASRLDNLTKKAIYTKPESPTPKPTHKRSLSHSSSSSPSSTPSSPKKGSKKDEEEEEEVEDGDEEEEEEPKPDTEPDTVTIDLSSLPLLQVPSPPKRLKLNPTDKVLKDFSLGMAANLNLRDDSKFWVDVPFEHVDEAKAPTTGTSVRTKHTQGGVSKRKHDKDDEEAEEEEARQQQIRAAVTPPESDFLAWNDIDLLEYMRSTPHLTATYVLAVERALHVVHSSKDPVSSTIKLSKLMYVYPYRSYFEQFTSGIVNIVQSSTPALHQQPIRLRLMNKQMEICSGVLRNLSKITTR